VVRIKVPGALAAGPGEHLTLRAPVSLHTHREHEWRDRIAQRRAVRYDVWRDERGRWYLDASWGYPQVPAVPLAVLQRQPTLGVDLNSGHLDYAVVDGHGNVVGTPQRLDVTLDALPAPTRDAMLRDTITRLIHLAQRHGCASITIEDLGFTDARQQGRETMGRGKRGKRFRRTVAGLPTAQFRQRLAGMTATAGLNVIAVDPAYTSRWAAQHWLTPLKTSDPSVDRHRAAAVVIGRRGLAHRARRKPAGPHARQRTPVGQPARPATPRGRPSHGPATLQPRAPDAAGPGEPRKRGPAVNTARTAKCNAGNSLALTP
jgi:IS605 OrfB family transposase